MKKRKTFFIILFLFFFCFMPLFIFETQDDVIEKKNLKFATQEIDEDFENDINEQLKDIDFSSLDEILKSLDDDQKKIINSSNFLDLIKNFIYSDANYSFQDFLLYLLKLLTSDIIKFLPYFISIFVITILYGIIEQTAFFNKNSTKNIVYMASAGTISIIIVKIVLGILKRSTGTIEIVSLSLEILFPIILTLITSLGGANTVSIFQPTLAIFSNIIVKIFTYVLIPIFIFSLIFNIVGSWSNNVKLENFSKFFISLFKSITGVVFTIFIAFLAIQGLTTSSLDGISIKTAKYALKNYIPILGSYLSDGVGLILLSTGIIKNAVGVAGLLLVGFLIIKPILEIILISLLFKLISAVIEPISQKTSKLLFDVSKSLSLINISLVAVGFMALISISILLSVSNLF